MPRIVRAGFKVKSVSHEALKQTRPYPMLELI